jgi:hypothetical protein
MAFTEIRKKHYIFLYLFLQSDKYFHLPLVKSPQLPLPSPVSTPEQKISTEEERSPFQADLRDITIPEIDYSKLLDDNIIEVTGQYAILTDKTRAVHTLSGTRVIYQI